MRRTFDFFLSFLLFLPVLLLIIFFSVLIIVIDRFSPFHAQKRVGRNGVLFTCFKLQTMKPPRYQSLIGEREKDIDRTTRLGTFIRDHGWDELPQIFNVLIGQMSFTGPRALLQKTLDRIRQKNLDISNTIEEWEKSREHVRPGISGWHQIHLVAPASILECDMEYLQNFSFNRQMKIFFITTLVFFLGKNLSGKIIP